MAKFFHFGNPLGGSSSKQDTSARGAIAAPSRAGYASRMQLETLPQTFAVCRLAPGEPFPDWSLGSQGMLCLFRTAEELSIVCEESLVPAAIKSEGGWRAFRVKGTLDFALTGVLAQITVPLAKAGISLFAVSSFDTDYVLVKAHNLAPALTALREAGHSAK